MCSGAKAVRKCQKGYNPNSGKSLAAGLFAHFYQKLCPKAGALATKFLKEENPT
jgi:hypothetical protein